MMTYQLPKLENEIMELKEANRANPYIIPKHPEGQIFKSLEEFFINTMPLDLENLIYDFVGEYKLNYNETMKELKNDYKMVKNFKGKLMYGNIPKIKTKTTNNFKTGDLISHTDKFLVRRIYKIIKETNKLYKVKELKSKMGYRGDYEDEYLIFHTRDTEYHETTGKRIKTFKKDRNHEKVINNGDFEIMDN